MNITKGVRARAQKVVIYGPEGIGKSSLAAQFPNALFIDTEGSTDNMDVARLDKPTSWTMLINQIRWVKANQTVCKTLVIDTIDWAERLAIESICALHNKKGIEDFGYGNGYVYVAEELGRFLNVLQDLIEVGINVVLTAHTQIRKFEQPDEMGSYDRYELKLGKKTASQTAPLVKEWADMVLFCNYKTYVVSDDKSNKKKAQGGQRVVYTAHHPAWDAKNRHGLPFEVPMAYESIAHVFDQQTPVEPIQVQQPASFQASQPPIQPDAKVAAVVQALKPEMDELDKAMAQATSEPVTSDPIPLKVTINPNIPVALQDLMRANHVTDEEIMIAVESRGYYPKGTPIENYDPGFVSGALVSAWDQVYAVIQEVRQTPF